MTKYKRKPLTSPALKTRTTPAGVFKALAGTSHLHACTNPECRLIYIDNCKEPRINGRCRNCSGQRRPIWEAARDPRPCCLDNTQQVTDSDELIRYDLAGPGPWFQCRTCARCHPPAVHLSHERNAMNMPIPAYEGRPVDGAAVKMSGAAPLEDLTDVVLGVDDMVQMVSMFRCVGVHHNVEEKTGKLIRVHILRPVEMHLAPIDPDNPRDDGIIRALPVGGGAPAISDGDDD